MCSLDPRHIFLNPCIEATGSNEFVQHMYSFIGHLHAAYATRYSENPTAPFKTAAFIISYSLLVWIGVLETAMVHSYEIQRGYQDDNDEE